MTPHASKPLVLCEGNEDRIIFEKIAEAAGLGNQIKFLGYGGDSKLSEFLEYIKDSPEYRRGEHSRILVTCDADDDSAKALKRLAAAIRKTFSCELTAPGETLASVDGLPISAWVVPGDGKSGMIETMCMEASREKSPELFDCIDPLIECLEKNQGAKPHEKVRFAFWTIISQGNTARKRLSVERAIDKVPLDWSCETFSPVRKLFADLLE
jgi:hypothetical protein